MKLTEKILWFLLLTSILLRIFIVDFVVAVIIFGLISASFYGLFSVLLLNHIPLRSAFKHEPYKNVSDLRVLGCLLTGIMYSIACIGIMFMTLRWPGSAFMLTAAELLLIINLLIVVYRARKKPDDKGYQTIKQRNIYFLFITSIFICFLNAPVHVKNAIFCLPPSQTADSLKVKPGS